MLESSRPSGVDLIGSEFSPAVAHLEQCPHCLERFHNVQACDMRIAESMRTVPIPLQLRERILARLAGRSLKRRTPAPGAIVAGVSIAAALIFALGFWVVSSDQPLSFGITELGEQVADFQVEEDWPVPLELQEVQVWSGAQLQELNLRSLPPPCPWLWRMVRVGSYRIQGREITVFRYHDTQSHLSISADVFAFDQRRFHIKDLRPGVRKVAFQSGSQVVIAWVADETVYFAVLRRPVPREWEPHRALPELI